MSTLTPHGACLLWKPALIWLNAASDAMIAGAFFATAFVLGFFLWRRRRDVMFRGVFWAFAIFATMCGVTRLLSILTLWVPLYDIEGFTKGFLALVSVGIAAALLLLLPRISMVPVITVRMLLKSCATPPVSWPMASIFCAWRTWASLASSS